MTRLEESVWAAAYVAAIIHETTSRPRPTLRTELHRVAAMEAGNVVLAMRRAMDAADAERLHPKDGLEGGRMQGERAQGEKRYESADLLERLAELSHERWACWTGCMHDKIYAHGDEDEWYDRWLHRYRTPYAQLSEEEKESDRVEARKVLALLKQVDEAARLKRVPAEEYVDAIINEHRFPIRVGAPAPNEGAQCRLCGVGYVGPDAIYGLDRCPNAKGEDQEHVSTDSGVTLHPPMSTPNPELARQAAEAVDDELWRQKIELCKKARVELDAYRRKLDTALDEIMAYAEKRRQEQKA